MATKMNRSACVLAMVLSTVLASGDAHAFLQPGYIGSRIVFDSPVGDACSEVAPGEECYVMPPLSKLLKLHFVGAVRELFVDLTGGLAAGVSRSPVMGLVESAV